MVVGLLKLPAELRLQILVLVIDYSTVHVLHSGSRICLNVDNTICPGPNHCHQDISLLEKEDSRCHSHFTAISKTCRQLHQEFQDLLYQKVAFSFLSAEIFENYFRYEPRGFIDHVYLLQRLGFIQIDIGPAKYADSITAAYARAALTKLARNASSLKGLQLTCGYYFQAHTDAILINNRTLRSILQFRDLQFFGIQFRDPPPGPHGNFHMPETLRDIAIRMKALEHVLVTYICSENSLKQRISEQQPNAVDHLSPTDAPCIGQGHEMQHFRAERIPSMATFKSEVKSAIGQIYSSLNHG